VRGEYGVLAKKEVRFCTGGQVWTATYKNLQIDHTSYMKNVETWKNIRDRDECVFKKPKEKIRNEGTVL